MKNKKMTYVLIVSVALVWGVIFYRIFTSAKGEEVVPSSTSYLKASYESLDDYTVKDTFRLALNYRDPFLSESGGRQAVATERSETEMPVISGAPRTAPFRPQVNWEGVKYSGYFINKGMKKVVAIVNVNGKEYMLNEGEVAGGVKLVKSFRDSVKISYQNETRFIKVQ